MEKYAVSTLVVRDLGVIIINPVAALYYQLRYSVKILQMVSVHATYDHILLRHVTYENIIIFTLWPG